MFIALDSFVAGFYCLRLWMFVVLFGLVAVAVRFGLGGCTLLLVGCCCWVVVFTVCAVVCMVCVA